VVERFLKAKHWQIFLVGLIIPFAAQMILFGILAFQMTTLQEAEDPSLAIFSGTIIGAFSILIIVSLISSFVLYGWMYSVGVGLKDYLPEGVHTRTKFFVFCLLFPIAYLFLFMFFYIQTFSSIFEGVAMGSPEPFVGGFFGMFFLIIPLHLFAMFCGIYVLRFVAKILKSVQLRRRARFNDYIGYFFLVWFYPIGIWILQPEINKIVSGDTSERVNDSGVLDA